ncbi:hypothetical protein F2P45_16260 [Massilia sp. CCM 8733]|uniref:Uncharacterized protein n=1 Tax=Massilia mucilaginosa TaxID=2609282 RepID=A0ABX0NUE7_9BURK|nr:hypothetical protein [Massilia mucilaginosa]NHZ90558.1 hypothetical protein [Massilia mucilaginosa]
MERYSWDRAQVGCMLCALRPGRRPKGDYQKSAWCEVDGGGMFACDVYHLPFDEVRGERNPNGLSIYLKFSLDEYGEPMLVLVSCHL